MIEPPKQPFNLFVTRYPGECAACHADAAVNGDPSLRW